MYLNIEGKIAIEGSPDVMDVSMRVAEFDAITQKRKTNYDATSGAEKISKLDTSMPVWVVVHGRVNSEETNQINEIAHNLQNLEYQVVTLDWSDAAKDVLPLSVSDADWTPAVGKWAAQQLVGMGFSPEQVNLCGHSHGTYVTYYAAEAMHSIATAKGFTGNESYVNSIVALDPAINPRALVELGSNDLPPSADEPPFINFGNVSQNSLAFVSSLLGSENLADTARTFIKIESDTGNLIERHGYAATLFSDILKNEDLGNTDPKMTRFYSSVLMGQTSMPLLAQRDGAEATIFTSVLPDEEDDDWFKAHFSDFSL